jgi:hypothetical protein
MKPQSNFSLTRHKFKILQFLPCLGKHKTLTIGRYEINNKVIWKEPIQMVTKYARHKLVWDELYRCIYPPQWQCGRT